MNQPGPQVAYWSAVTLLCLLAGCGTYAPPIRGLHYGAPGRIESGQLEVSGSAGGLLAPYVGGPQLAYGITDWAALEAGANLYVLDQHDGWTMGYLGPRFSYVPHRKAPIHFIGDVELGLGLGLGGAFDGNGNPNPPTTSGPTITCNDCDGLNWSDRLAGGGYQGIDIGGRFHFFSLFVRARLEESSARGVPLTLWPSAYIGGEFEIRRRVALGLGAGYLGYFNSKKQLDSYFYQISVTVLLDARWTRTTTAATAR